MEGAVMAPTSQVYPYFTVKNTFIEDVTFLEVRSDGRSHGAATARHRAHTAPPPHTRTPGEGAADAEEPAAVVEAPWHPDEHVYKHATGGMPDGSMYASVGTLPLGMTIPAFDRNFGSAAWYNCAEVDIYGPQQAIVDAALRQPLSFKKIHLKGGASFEREDARRKPQVPEAEMSAGVGTVPPPPQATAPELTEPARPPALAWPKMVALANKVALAKQVALVALAHKSEEGSRRVQERFHD